MVAKQPLKILEVVASLAVGGAERIALEIAAGLNAAAHLGVQAELAVAGGPENSNRYERSTLSEAKKRGLTVHEVRGAPNEGDGWKSHFRTLLRERQYDLVHVHNRPRDWQIARQCLLMGVPMVYSVHKPYAHESLRTRLLYAALARAVAPVICVSRTVAEHVARTEWAPLRNLRVIYNGVNIRTFARLQPEQRLAKRAEMGWGRDEVVWLCAARFHPQKAHEYLLEAVGRLPPGSRSRLVLAGEGPLEPELRRQSERLRLGERVTFLGPRSDVPALLGAADFYVMCSREEGHPLSLLEAMACELPILAPRLPSVVEIAAEGAPTFFGPAVRGIARSHDPAQIAEAMLRLEESPDAARMAAAASRAHVTGTFSLEAMISRHCEVYHEALDARRRPTRRIFAGIGAITGVRPQHKS